MALTTNATAIVTAVITGLSTGGVSLAVAWRQSTGRRQRRGDTRQLRRLCRLYAERIDLLEKELDRAQRRAREGQP